MTESNKIKDVMFRPFLLKTEDLDPTLIIITEMKETKTTRRGAPGEDDISGNIIIGVIDVGKSRESGFVTINQIVVKEETLLPLLEAADVEDFNEELSDVYATLAQQTIAITQQLAEYTNALNVLSKIAENNIDEDLPEKGSLSYDLELGGGDERFVNIGLDFGVMKKPLSDKEEASIMNTIKQSLRRFVDIDTEDKVAVSRLVKDLEIDIISVLPDRMSISDFEIDTEKIVTAIKSLKEQMEDDNEDSEGELD